LATAAGCCPEYIGYCPKPISFAISGSIPIISRFFLRLRAPSPDQDVVPAVMVLSGAGSVRERFWCGCCAGACAACGGGFVGAQFQPGTAEHAYSGRGCASSAIGVVAWGGEGAV
jgi:hypothetical protein